MLEHTNTQVLCQNNHLVKYPHNPHSWSCLEQTFESEIRCISVRDGKIPRFARCIGKKVNDANHAMHRFKKCASDTFWHLYRDASFLKYLHR